MDIETISPKEVEKEVSEWIAYLNEIVGGMCFTLGLACLGTPNPPFYAAISMAFVLIFHLPNAKIKATTLNYLANKKDLTHHEKFILKELRGKINFKKSILAWFGYSFLFLVASVWAVLNEFPKIYTFVYG